MKAKFKFTHRFYSLNKKTSAVIPEGTICPVTYYNKGKSIQVSYKDPEDEMTKYLLCCLHCHGDKIELLED